MKICVVIPACNESRHLGDILRSVRSQGLDVIVIDDGSTDETGRIAEECGARVIRHENRQGKGYSLREGFQLAVREDYDGVIAIDGDGQHSTGDLQAFIDEARHHKVSIIAGNRMGSVANMPFIRYCTNRFMSFLISLACRQSIPDSQCGFRYAGCDVLRAITLTSRDYEIESEMLIKAAKKDFKIYHVPIKTIYSDEKSKIDPVRDTVRFFAFYIKEVFSSDHK